MSKKKHDLKGQQPGVDTGDRVDFVSHRVSEPVPYGHDAATGAIYYGSAQDSTGLLSVLSLRKITRLARHKWITLLVSIFFAFVFSGIYLLAAPRVYRASALVELSVRRPRIAGQQGAVIDDSYAYSFQPEEIFFVTRLEKFKGSAVLETALNALKASGQVPKGMADDALRTLLKTSVKMSLIRRSRLAQITFDHTDPVFAAFAANAFASATEALAFEENKTVSDNAVAWLQTQAAVQRKALEKADQALVDFRARNKLDSLESSQKTTSEALLDFNKAVTEVEGNILLIRDLDKDLSAMEVTPENAGKLPMAVPRAVEIQSMLEKWLNATAERDALLTRYTTKHPEVVAKDQLIAILRAQTVDAIRRARQTSASNLALLEKQAKSFHEKIDGQTKQAAALELLIVEKRAELSALERERDAADISYRGILTRIEEARLSADENTASVKIAEPATPPDLPFKPRKGPVMILAMVAGLFIGLMLALITDALEDKVSDADDLERELGLKVLGLVPCQDNLSREQLATLCMSAEPSHFSEVFSGIRAVLESEGLRTSCRAVLVASTAPEEGKTITACNLAVSFARAGKRTLLVDFDMRRPRLNRIFKIQPDAKALAQALSGQTGPSFEKLAHPSLCDNLWVVVSRSLDGANPADLIGGSETRKFLQWALAQYDRVILDSPPFGVVNDSAVLGSLVGCVVLVCRPGKSRKHPLRHAMKKFQEVDAHVLGVVVNNVKQSSFRRFNYYYTQDDYNKYHVKGPSNAQAQVGASEQRGSA
ncbi:MAG: polysaccharide biosynthesis tyrosine autokinase [Lentisphaerota bacterium]